MKGDDKSIEIIFADVEKFMSITARGAFPVPKGSSTFIPLRPINNFAAICARYHQIYRNLL
jgi:hypothetical protein